LTAPEWWTPGAREFSAASDGPTVQFDSDQQLSHVLNCLVIFDVFGQPGVAPSLPARCRASLAQHVSDVLVHVVPHPYLRLSLPPRARPALYVAPNASALKSCSTGKPRNSLSLLRTSADGAVTPLHTLTTWL
jgi:hypothetical protein